MPEEGEREVQRLVGHGAPDRRDRPPPSRNAASAARAALGQVKRDEEPRASRAAAGAARASPRSWSARGSSGGRRAAARCGPSARRPAPTLRQTVPTGFSSVPPPGPAIAGDADADVGAEARPRAVGQRRGDLGRHRAVALDQLRGHVRERRSWPRWSRRRRRPARTRRSPRGRSAAPPSARRCRTRPSRRSGPVEQRRPPGRRSSSRRRRTACRAWRSRIAASKRVVDRRGGGLEHRRDLDLAAAQAGRDLELLDRHAVRLDLAQRRGDLGLGDPEQPQHPLLVGRRRLASSAAQRLGLDAPSPTSAAARAAGPGARPPSAGSRARPARARCRPARARSRPRARAPACGCRRASASSSRLRQRLRRRSRIAQIRSSSASSSASGAARRSRRPPRRSGRRRSGRGRRW